MQPVLSSSQGLLANALQSGSGSGMRYNAMLQHQLHHNNMSAADRRYEHSGYQNAMHANQSAALQQHTKQMNSEQISQRSVQAEDKIYALVLDLMNPELREQALLELSKKRELYDDLALVLWHSYGAYHHIC
jgi:hypothetical protein